MLRKILLIFLISFGGVAVTVGGAVGIKYLKGDFKEKIVSPENISFEQNEYFFDGENNTYQIKITTTTENVNQDNVTLIFDIGGKETAWDSEYISDGNIIVPKNVKLNQPFTVTIIKDQKAEVVGGISKLIARSDNKMIDPSETTVYVDVPASSVNLNVYRQGNEDNQKLGIGEGFFVEANLAPTQSEAKYSKYSSSKFLTENYEKALSTCKARGLEVEELFSSLKNAQNGYEYATAYKQIFATAGVSEALGELVSEFEENLKYVKLVENVTNVGAKFQEISRLPGSNIYFIVSPAMETSAEIIAYSFKNITKETEMASMLSNSNILTTLEQLYINGETLKASKVFEVSTLSVDSINLNGSISDLYRTSRYSIYATSGLNDGLNSYLGVKLQNKNLPNLNLQSQIKNIGLRFEKKVAGEWRTAGDDIELIGEYKSFEDENKNIYYKPLGEEPNWTVRVKNVTQAEYRVVIAYESKLNNEIIILEDSKRPSFRVHEIEELNENNLSWTQNNPVDLTIVNIDGVAGTGDASIQSNPSFDLSNVVDWGAVRHNVYQTVKYFIYTDEIGINISDCFDVKDVGKTYSFADGTSKTLFELNASTIQLKGIDKAFDGKIYGVYATVRTDENGAIIIKDGKYDFAKVSSYFEYNVERLSGLEINFIKTLSGLTGSFESASSDLAGVVTIGENTGEFHVAQNATGALKVKISANSGEFAKLKQAYEADQIAIFAKKDGAIGNFVSVDGFEFKTTNDGEYVELILNTGSVENDTIVSLTISYSIDGTSYLFEVLFKNDNSTELVNQNQLTIVYDTSTHAKFNFGEGNDPLEIMDSDVINVSTIYNEGTFTQKYTLNNGEEDIKTKLFKDGNILLVLGENFLNTPIPYDNEWYNSGWHLTSSAPNVVSIMGEHNQKMQAVGEGDATISLFVNDSDKVQQTIKIHVNSAGYVSKMERGGVNPVEQNYAKGDYKFATVYIDVEGAAGATIDLSKIFILHYYLNETDNDITLSLTTNITNPDASYNDAITCDSEHGTITLNKNFGGALSIDVLYQLDSLGIKQKVVINIQPVIGLNTFGLQEGTELIAPEEQGGAAIPVYDVYAAKDYSISCYLKGPSGTTAKYYLVSGTDDNVTFTTLPTSTISASDATLSFSDVAAETIYTICISNEDLVENKLPAWALNYRINFKVKPNIRIKNNNLAATIEDGNFKLYIEDIVERDKKNSNDISYTETVGGGAQYNFDITATFESPILGGEDSRKFEFRYDEVARKHYMTLETYGGLPMQGVVDELTVTAKIKYFNYEVGTFTVTLTPRNYEKTTTAEASTDEKIPVAENRIFTYNGERAFVFVVGDPLDYQRTIIWSQFIKDKKDDETLNNSYSITNSSNFNSQYYSKGTSKHITTSSSSLLYLVPNSVLEMKDEYGNKLTYRIVISQIPLTALNLTVMAFGDITYDEDYGEENNNDNFLSEYRKIDLYNLFMESGEAIYNAYSVANLTVAKGQYYGGQEINVATLFNEDLFETDSGGNPIYGVVVGYELSLPLEPNELASKYAELELSETGYIVKLNQIGSADGLYLEIDMKYMINGNIYRIPCVIKIEQSQRLDVVYEFENKMSNGADTKALAENYGTDNYDNGMLSPTTPFSNIPMQYATFNINGNANIDLARGQLVVNKYKETKDEVDVWEESDYNDYWQIAVEKLAINTSGTWNFEDKNSYNNFVVIDEHNLSVNIKRNGCTGVRVKLKVTIKSGSTNYYYIQVGDVPNVVLAKNTKDSNAQNVIYNESITLSKEDILVFANKVFNGTSPDITLNENQIGIAYYLKDYNTNNLKYKLGNGEDFSKYFKVDELDNTTKYSTNKLPNGATFDLVLYTKYGELAKVHVTINPYYTSQLKKTDSNGNPIALYGGAAYSISQIVEINQGATSQSSFEIDLEESAKRTDTFNIKYNSSNSEEIEYIYNEYYAIKLEAGNPLIIFNHSEQSYTIPKLVVVVKIGTNEPYDTYTIELENVVIEPVIKAVEGTPEVQEIVSKMNTGKTAMEITLTDGKISTGGETVWKQLFKDFPKGIVENNISYYYTYGNERQPVATNTDSITIDVGVVTVTTEITIIFTIRGTNVDGSFVEISKPLTLRVIPPYSVKINYPQPNANTNYGVEYVQAGSTINFAGENFSGNKRVEVVDNNNKVGGSSSATWTAYLADAVSENQSVTFAKDWSGEVEVGIMIEGFKFAGYNIYVQADNPFAVDISRINEKTVYIGYGDDKPLEYVDITLRLDTEKLTGLSDGDKFSIVAKYYDDENKEQTLTILEDLYYRGEEASKVYKFVIALEDFDSNKINPQTIFAVYKIGDEEQPAVKCKAVEISRRYNVTYNGDDVNFEYLNKILSFEYPDKSEEENFYRFTIAYDCDSVKSDSETAGTYVKAYDIYVTVIPQSSDYDIVMNANEFGEAGLSLVELFQIVDGTGKKLWYNHISKFLGNATAQITLAITGTDAPSNYYYPVRLEAQIHDGVIYDYNIIALGARNNGTIVTLTFTYGLAGDNSQKFSKELKIKVLPDIEYSLLNYDATETPNSSVNPLVINEVKTFILARANQTTTYNTNYYIYAYSKFDTKATNRAQTFRTTTSGSGLGCATLQKNELNNNLELVVSSLPEFGDKSFIIEFTDSFGFVFTYYIRLKADNTITSVRLVNEQVFEGDKITVGNKKYNPISDILVNFENPEDAGGKPTQAYIKKIEYVGNNEKIQVATSVDNNGKLIWKLIWKYVYEDSNKKEQVIEYVIINLLENGLEFKSAPQEFWKMVGGLSYEIDIILYISNSEAGNADTYATQTLTINYTKRYGVELDPQNTYVRDNVEFHMENLVTVRDYKEGCILGEPVLNEMDAIQVQFTLDTTWQTPVAANFTYKNSEGIDKQLSINQGTSIATLISKAITDDNKDGYKEFLQQRLGIMIDVDESGKISISVAMLVVAKNKYTNNTISCAIDFKLDAEYKVDLNNELNYITVGEDSEYFKTITDIDIYEFSLVHPDNLIIDSGVEAGQEKSFVVANQVDGVDIPFCKKIRLTTLQVAVADSVEIHLVVDDAHYFQDVTNAQKVYKLINSNYLGKNVTLYTGEYGDTETPYVNGLTLDNVRIAKNISVNSSNNSGTTKKLPLNLNADFYSDLTNGAKYQEQLEGYNLKIKDMEYNFSDYIRVTTKYTGVDTSNAYVGTYMLHTVNLEKLEATREELHDAYLDKYDAVNSDGITANINEWSNGFKLVPGFGKSREFALNSSENLNFYGMSDDSNIVSNSLSFALKAVSANTGSDTSDSGNSNVNLVEITPNGKITLKPGFKVKEYYISIEVFCLYPIKNVNDGDENTKFEKLSIGTVLIAFDYDATEIYKGIAKDNQNKSTLESSYSQDYELQAENYNTDTTNNGNLSGNVEISDIYSKVYYALLENDGNPKLLKQDETSVSFVTRSTGNNNTTYTLADNCEFEVSLDGEEDKIKAQKDDDGNLTGITLENGLNIGSGKSIEFTCKIYTKCTAKDKDGNDVVINKKATPIMDGTFTFTLNIKPPQAQQNNG